MNLKEKYRRFALIENDEIFRKKMQRIAYDHNIMLDLYLGSAPVISFLFSYELLYISSTSESTRLVVDYIKDADPFKNLPNIVLIGDSSQKADNDYHSDISLYFDKSDDCESIIRQSKII